MRLVLIGSRRSSVLVEDRDEDQQERKESQHVAVGRVFITAMAREERPRDAERPECDDEEEEEAVLRQRPVAQKEQSAHKRERSEQTEQVLELEHLAALPDEADEQRYEGEERRQ